MIPITSAPPEPLPEWRKELPQRRAAIKAMHEFAASQDGIDLPPVMRESLVKIEGEVMQFGFVGETRQGRQYWLGYEVTMAQLYRLRLI